MGRIQRQIAVLLLATATALASQPALSSTTSQRYYTKGLVPFHAGELERAYTSFTNATRADPNDAVAFYYRGVTGARLGFQQEAIADLEHALEIRPDLAPAVLDLGVLYLEAGEYERAETWLERAYDIPENRFQAALFLGVANYRRGDDTSAQKYLRDAAKNPRLRATANYYEGLALLRQGQGKPATQLLDSSAANLPDTAMAAAVSEFRSGDVPLTLADDDTKPWSIQGGLGFGFDSNVALAPNDSAVKNSRNSAGINPDYRDTEVGRVQLELNASYRFLDTDIASGTATYELYQDFNFNNSDFDLSSHRIRLDFTTPSDRWYQFGVTGWYNYYAMDFSSFFHEGTATPWVVFYEGDVTATQVYYRFRGRDYVGSPFNPWRDSVNNAVGLRQYFLLGAIGRSLSVGYQWSDNDPLSKDGTDFAYYTNQFDIQLEASVRDWFDTSLGYALLLDDYKHPNSRTGFVYRRHDADHQIVIHIERPLTRHLTASLDYFGIINDSNLEEFDYDRSIITANVRMHF